MTFAITPIFSVAAPSGESQDMVVDFFACHSVEYDLRVQLCTDLDTRPRTVATIRFDRHDSEMECCRCAAGIAALTALV